MKKYISIAALACVLLIAACAGRKLATPLQADADRGAATFTGLTLDQLVLGKQVLEANCGACHDMPKPKHESAEAWKGIVPNMVTKANRKLGDTIDKDKEEALLRYLIVMGAQ
ncbi:MAG: hypothetical protein U0176_26425 [Bacteroidia bacterium]